ncbi:hypothetical protein T265_12076 [Opisthorchis viverrini]|uniref:Uncharacterized protein n=1 Tax=Opisthorchis viverrini TaxID=6198 RepID=A0A074Z6V1_OPIVI|nr:hypothetical protein T265_12076 [Opisthorchis viverrini]KER18965.1 hypothetical protein T265_12076 [Opisthorchis viverrini]
MSTPDQPDDKLFEFARNPVSFIAKHVIDGGHQTGISIRVKEFRLPTFIRTLLITRLEQDSSVQFSDRDSAVRRMRSRLNFYCRCTRSSHIGSPHDTK